MAIKFHCEHCGKKIEAAESAAGKWGKCPACHNKVYIPEPETGDDLKLAPLDESDSTKQKELLAETFKLTQVILQEKNLPEGGVAGPAATSADDIGDKELTVEIILCLRLLADGDSEGAGKHVETIVLCGRRSLKILDRIALSEIPEPELADIRPQALSGLIRDLRSRIKQ